MKTPAGYTYRPALTHTSGHIQIRMERKGRLCGEAWIEFNGPRKPAKLRHILVNKGHRGNGGGNRLLMHVCEWLDMFDVACCLHVKPYEPSCAGKGPVDYDTLWCWYANHGWKSFKRGHYDMRRPKKSKRKS